MLYYALIQCKIFGLKIRKCKIFDKYHVWLGLISLRPSNQGPVCMFVCLFVFFPLATFIRAKCRWPDAAIWGHWAQLVKDKLALQRRCWWWWWRWRGGWIRCLECYFDGQFQLKFSTCPQEWDVFAEHLGKNVIHIYKFGAARGAEFQFQMLCLLCYGSFYCMNCHSWTDNVK